MYHELTTKDLLAQTRGFIREIESKIHGSEQQAAMNRLLAAHYKTDPKAKGHHENARQQVAKDEHAAHELRLGLPALLDHLAELQAQDAAEDAEREASEPQDESVAEEPTPLHKNGKRESVPV